jgi:diguanylate cyclase (GGDEF)-like protein/PAS domain S-box-containing protein
MTRKHTILIVDDARHNRTALREILNDNYIVLEAENGQNALAVLEEKYQAVTVIILDLIMPDMSGLELLEIFHKDVRYQNIPVIAMLRGINDEIECKCLEYGAWDFMRKPYDPMIVRFRVKNVIERSQMRVDDELKYRAEYDVLTGILNKSKFFYNTRNMLNIFGTEDFAFIRIDIEKFQLINSFFGMDEGDNLLKYMADYLQNVEKEYRYITYGRIEADIFAVCFSYKNEKEITDFVKKFTNQMEKYPLDFDITPFFGVYLVKNRDLSINEMYDKANLASKNCKGNYIQNYFFYTKKMSEEIIKEQRIINNMKNALKNEEFVLYLQPKYELQRNSIAGAEVLVRWITADGRMISPGEFIPVFERNGFILKLDQYVWEKTCQLLAGWRDEGRKIFPVSVNISRVSLYNPKIVDVICGLTEKYNIPPEWLQLELTESAYTGNPKAIKEMMEQLQKKGFSILMDDFGSGYSSLNVLKDIAVDVLKIDMKFLDGSGDDGRSENILASVVRMAKWLNMPVVAEGAERKEQVSFLHSIGCEYVQGYYFARPMPVKEYEKLLYEQPYFEDDETRRTSNDTNAIWTANMQMEMIFSNMMQAAAIYEYCDGNIEVVRVNDAYFDLFGYHDTDRVHKEIEGSIDHFDRERFMDTFAQVVENQSTAECEVKRFLESGREIWIKLRLKYINRVGERHIIFGCIDDITVQREMDNELAKYRLALMEEEVNEKTMLVVDDMEINRASLESIFETDYRILQAGDGEEALRILEEQNYKVDMILLDLMMPGMNGQTFMQERKNDPRILNIPVVIITADDTTEQQVLTMELGASDYIVKPFIPETCAECLGFHKAKKRSSAGASEVVDKQKKLRVFYSDISALRDRSDQPQLWEFLCCARQQKIKQCKNEDDRLRAFGAGLLLEYGLRQYGYTQTIPVGSSAAAELEQTGQTRSLQQVRFVYGENGKPYLGTGQGERLPLMFNLSHSGMYVAAAFGTEDIGVDVELMRTGKQKIAQRFFAEDERKYLEKCWTDEAFTGIWTRKEAYIKAVGTGIAMSLDSFSTMEEQVGEYYLKTWNVKRDVWLSVCRKGSVIERCLPEKIALEQVFL